MVNCVCIEPSLVEAFVHVHLPPVWLQKGVDLMQPMWTSWPMGLYTCHEATFNLPEQLAIGVPKHEVSGC